MVHLSFEWDFFYTADRSADCIGTINPGETCLFTNTYAPPPPNIAHLNVIVRVDNTGCLNQCAEASDFDISVGGGSPRPGAKVIPLF
jgi:hypothetical protein